MERTGTSTPAEQTLKDLQSRLNEAEDQAKNLISRLGKYGFKKVEMNESQTRTVPKAKSKTSYTAKEPISSLHLLSNRSEKSYRPNRSLEQSLNHQELIGKVSKMEDTLQSLKLDIDTIEAVKIFETDKGKIEQLKENQQQTVKKLNKEISNLKKDKDSLKVAKKELANENNQLKKKIEVLQSSGKDNDGRLNDLQFSNQKLLIQLNEVCAMLMFKQPGCPYVWTTVFMPRW